MMTGLTSNSWLSTTNEPLDLYSNLIIFPFPTHFSVFQMISMMAFHMTSTRLKLLIPFPFSSLSSNDFASPFINKLEGVRKRTSTSFCHKILLHPALPTYDTLIIQHQNHNNPQDKSTQSLRRKLKFKKGKFKKKIGQSRTGKLSLYSINKQGCIYHIHWFKYLLIGSHVPVSILNKSLGI